MYDYVVKELPELLKENFPELDTARASISGHSMGGHGALTIYLKNLDKYKVFLFTPYIFCLVVFLLLPYKKMAWIGMAAQNRSLTANII